MQVAPIPKVARQLSAGACETGKFRPKPPRTDSRRPGKQTRSTRNGKKTKSWSKIGAAFPHKEGVGFNIGLKAFPIDGRLVALPPDTDNSNRNGK